jgi:heme oxygenase
LDLFLFTILDSEAFAPIHQSNYQPTVPETKDDSKIKKDKKPLSSETLKKHQRKAEVQEEMLQQYHAKYSQYRIQVQEERSKQVRNLVVSKSTHPINDLPNA